MRTLRLDSITPEVNRRVAQLAVDAVEPNVFLEADFVFAARRSFGVASDICLPAEGVDGK